MATYYSGPESYNDWVSKAIRLTFDYEQERLKVISEEKIEKIVPLFREIDDKESGTWIELKDKKGNVLHTQAMDIPFGPDREVFSSDPEEPSITRENISDFKGTFSILIPDLSEVAEVEIFSSPVFSEAGLSGKATKIFHHSLKKEE
jgi:hypothetical protein